MKHRPRRIRRYERPSAKPPVVLRFDGDLTPEMVESVRKHWTRVTSYPVVVTDARWGL